MLGSLAINMCPWSHIMEQEKIQKG
uniref:Uncharacterized protein n=1 Tax=Arundo donax TaxID=35708 RepID=A0A0A9BQH7_ARUDO